MKNLVIASFLSLGLISSAWAAEKIDIHERVNNAQAPAHQVQTSAAPALIKGSESQLNALDQHEQAVIAHETMKNSSSDAHQKVVDGHLKMASGKSASSKQPAKSYTEMNEHEKAAVAHETMKNGQSGAHQVLAEKHRRLSQAD